MASSPSKRVSSPNASRQSVAASSIATNSGKYDYLMKLIMIGDSCVGKSCLLIRFSEDTFTTSFISTVGIDFKVRTIQIDDKIIKLQVYDTAGQDRFRTITAAYYRGSHGVLLVYDVTDERSFSNIRTWIAAMPEHTSAASKLIVGNKCDLDDKRAVPMHKGQVLAQEYGFDFVETSAKTNINVDLAFTMIVKEIKTKMESNKMPVESKDKEVKLKETPQAEKPCAC